MGFYREKHAPAPHPSYPQMSSTPSTAHLGIFHDLPHLHTFDDKTVQRVIGVQTFSLAIFTALAVLRSKETCLIVAPGAKRLSPLFSKGGLGEM